LTAQIGPASMRGMWLFLACVRAPEPPPAGNAEPPVVVAAPAPPPAPVDPCSVPDRAVECLAQRVAATPEGCAGAACVARCTDHPADAACAGAVESFRATCALPPKGKGADGRACRALAHQLPPEARPEVLWRGCDANDGVSCLFLAELVEDGAPLPKASRGDVAWLREQACDLQVNYACASHRW
jgi:hypothetical protein